MNAYETAMKNLLCIAKSDKSVEILYCGKTAEGEDLWQVITPKRYIALQGIEKNVIGSVNGWEMRERYSVKEIVKNLIGVGDKKWIQKQ